MDIKIDVYGLDFLEEAIKRVKTLKEKHPEINFSVRVIVGHSG